MKREIYEALKRKTEKDIKNIEQGYNYASEDRKHLYSLFRDLRKQIDEVVSATLKIAGRVEALENPSEKRLFGCKKCRYFVEGCYHAQCSGCLPSYLNWEKERRTK